MGKTETKITNPAFQDSLEKKTGFNTPSLPSSSFNSVYDTRTFADDKTNEAIDRLMGDLKGSKGVGKEDFAQDGTTLRRLTAEVKAIEKQSVLLVGERVHQARAILGKYNGSDETFTAWLAIAFKHRSTAYNMLVFYEFHKALPNASLQKQLIEMPQKAAYALASRKGEMVQKVEIILKYSEMPAEDIIAAIQNAFPSTTKKKKVGSGGQIDKLRSCLRGLLAKKRSLKEADIEAIQECRTLFDDLLDSKETAKD
jgi:hypothetical protein